MDADDACTENTRLTTFFKQYKSEFSQYDENFDRIRSLMYVSISWMGLIVEPNDTLNRSLY